MKVRGTPQSFARHALSGYICGIDHIERPKELKHTNQSKEPLTMDDSPDLIRWFTTDGPRLLANLEIHSRAPVVDFGCGVGSLALPLASVVADAPVFAIDQSAENIETVRVRARMYGPFPNLRLLHTDGRLRFTAVPTRSCQAVFLFDVLQHIEDWDTLFRECARILPTGGALQINPSIHSHPGEVNMQLLEERLDSAGFMLGSHRRTRLMHYKHFEEDEVFSFAKVTSFQRRVYRALQTVPPGKLTTYGHLAEAVGCGCPQAIGQALRQNPCAPRVPCHRVIAADGTLGGFAGAADAEAKRDKQGQLEAEGIPFDERGRVADPDCIITPR